MAFKPLYQASTAKPTSSFKPLGSLSNTAPTFELPTPAKKPSGFLNYIKSVPSKIKEAFTSGGAQIESGVKTIRQGGTPIQGAEAGLKIGAGFTGVIFSPIAPVTDLIGKAIQFSGDQLAKTSLIKNYANTATETDVRVLEALQNLGGVAMGILGAKTGEVKGEIPKAKLAEISQHPEVIKAVEKVYEAQTKATEVAIEKPTPSFKPIKPVAEPIPQAKLSPVQETLKTPEAINPAQSGVGRSIETKAIEAGLAEKFDKVASYDASTIKEQARIFADTFNAEGIEGMRAIVRGEKPLPAGAKDFPFLVSMEAYLKENPNFDMAYELANSPLATAASEAGSQLGLGQNRIQDSYTARIQEIRKARESKVKSADVKRTALRKKSQENLNKVNLTAEDLGKIDKFIDKIIC